MLVLTRKKEQKICIGPDVTITVLRVRGNSVKIGVEAPAGTRILRGELSHSFGKRHTGAGEASPAGRSMIVDATDAAARSTETGAGPAEQENGCGEDLGSSRQAPRERTASYDGAYRGAGRSLAPSQ